MKPNYLGIVGGILALVSLALPWWTMSLSSASGAGTSMDVTIYPYMAQVGGTIADLSARQLMFGWAALVFTVMGGAVGIVAGVVAGVKPGKLKGYYGRRLNIGSLGLLSVIFFAVMLQIELLQDTLGIGLSNVFLFGSGQLYFTEYGINANYFSYLSFGFWLALAASIVLFVAFRKKPVEAAVAPQPSPPPAMQ